MSAEKIGYWLGTEGELVRYLCAHWPKRSYWHMYRNGDHIYCVLDDGEDLPSMACGYVAFQWTNLMTDQEVRPVRKAGVGGYDPI